MSDKKLCIITNKPQTRWDKCDSCRPSIKQKCISKNTGCKEPVTTDNKAFGW